MVSRVTLQNMRQNRDEPVRGYCARLNGQAGVCKFIMKCSNCQQDVNYTDSNVRVVLARGIADPDIELDLLGDTNQNMTLEEVIQFVEAKKSGKRSVHCNRDNHFESVRRSKEKSKSKVNTNDVESAVFDALCATYSSNEKRQQNRTPITMDHHLYDHLSDSWIKKCSKPQPYIRVTISMENEDYTSLVIDLSTPSESIDVLAMADTSCLDGMKIIHKLGLKETELIPVTLKMHAANGNGIKILGAVILRISGINDKGKRVETRQMTYITDCSDKLFLSREACTALGIIPDSFPTLGNTHGSVIADIVNENIHMYENTSCTDEATLCDCPKRTLPPKPPIHLPYEPTEENRTKLQEFLLNYYKASTFNTCEHQPLPLMKGTPMRLMIDQNATPVAYHTPVPVPLHWQAEVKAGIDRDVCLGVIEPVPVGEPVTWCHKMVVCAKKNGKPRRTVDFQPLNKYASRETHHTQSPFHQARSVPPNTKKTVLDAWNGYHSVPIHEDDRHFTTFITPWGRYRYKTAPQGYIASGYGYTRHYDEIVADIPNKTKCIDDVLLWSDSLEDSFFQTAQWLYTCGENGIVLNPDKFIFGEDVVEFAGFEITQSNVRPSKTYLQAIKQFPTPSNITDIRSWFGLVNQVSYAFSMTEKMLPFRELLKPGVKFKWDEQLDKLFNESKSVIISEIEEGVKIFNHNKTTCLATDWSKDGIGFWLFQKHCECQVDKPFCCPGGWKIVLVGSRFTHSAEARYAPTEGEALAVADALDKARYFVLGCDKLILAVDHKPLHKILGNRYLEDIPNSRLRNLKEKTLLYRFTVVHIPGVKHKAADCVSRHQTGLPEKLILTDDIATMNTDTVDNFLATIRIPNSLYCHLEEDLHLYPH